LEREEKKKTDSKRCVRKTTISRGHVKNQGVKRKVTLFAVHRFPDGVAVIKRRGGRERGGGDLESSRFRELEVKKMGREEKRGVPSWRDV